MLLTLLLASAIDVSAARYAVQSVRPVRELTRFPQTESIQTVYARDDHYEYLALPDGLYRGARLGDPNQPLERIGFAGQSVHSVAVHDGKLYVLRGEGSSTLVSQPTLLRSTDRGATFTSLSENLKDCSLGPCEYLAGDDIAFAENRIFVNAGGNLLVSGDDGASWTILYGLPGSDGKPAAQLCPVEFQRVGERMLLGGECPLDVAWLSAGTLRPDLLGWAEQPRAVNTPWMENRNIQFIRHLGGDEWLVAIEGAILKSSDNGASFRWVMHEDIDTHDFYPYLWEFLQPAAYPDLLIAAGFDKKEARAHLLYSPDRGESWINASHLLGPTTFPSAVTNLTVDADGRLLAVVHDAGRFDLVELEIGLAKEKRRAVRK
ncbi:MAG TPA: hypothetical protein VGF48_26795 [Thermoanaerobaculia bacterium]